MWKRCILYSTEKKKRISIPISTVVVRSDQLLKTDPAGGNWHRVHRKECVLMNYCWLMVIGGWLLQLFLIIIIIINLIMNIELAQRDRLWCCMVCSNWSILLQEIGKFVKGIIIGGVMDNADEFDRKTKGTWIWPSWFNSRKCEGGTHRLLHDDEMKFATHSMEKLGCWRKVSSSDGLSSWHLDWSVVCKCSYRKWKV